MHSTKAQLLPNSIIHTVAPAEFKSVHCGCHNLGCQYLHEKLIDPPETESIMYTGGTIRPLKDGNAGVAKAIGFKVAAVGTPAEVTAQMNSLGVQYSEVNLPEGQTLLPGFIDPHIHLFSTSTSSWVERFRHF